MKNTQIHNYKKIHREHTITKQIHRYTITKNTHTNVMHKQDPKYKSQLHIFPFTNTN